MQYKKVRVEQDTALLEVSWDEVIQLVREVFTIANYAEITDVDSDLENGGIVISWPESSGTRRVLETMEISIDNDSESIQSDTDDESIVVVDEDEDEEFLSPYEGV